MHTWTFGRATLIATMALFPLSVLADVVVLTNGDRLSGNIVRFEGETLTLETEQAGTVSIKWATVSGITSSQPLYVTAKDGRLLLGTVEAAAGQVHVRTRDAGTATLPKESVESIRSSQEQALYRAWTGFADAGLSLARGNAETTTVTAGINARRPRERDLTSIYFTALFAQSAVLGIQETTAQALRGGIRYEFNLSERFFAFGFTDLEHDRFQQLDLRNVIGVGAGMHFIKSERASLDFFLGASFNQEFFEPLTRRTGELLLGDDFAYKLSDRAALTQRLVIFPNVSDFGEFRAVFDASAVTQLYRWLGWHITLGDRFQSNPLPGVRQNDILLSTGVRVVFGRERL
jgi:putative salt-induced outer membrane protein